MVWFNYWISWNWMWTFLAYSGETTVGGIIAGGTVVSLVSVFVIGKKIQKSDD